MININSPLVFLAFVCVSNALPTSTKPLTAAKVVTAIDDVQLINPQLITIEHFEDLLRRAGEIFHTSNIQLVPATPAASKESQEQQSPSIQQVPVPYQQMQPPVEQPFNFYLPLFQFEDNNSKLDEKSRQMENFAPPPEPLKDQQNINYYLEKPKKLPKKFNAGAKHVNLNWIVDLEKQALIGKDTDFSKTDYMINDERNRINFDDTFFGVDMQVAVVPTNAEQSPKDKEKAPEEEYLNQGEEMVDDLMAAPTVQKSQLQREE